MFSSILEYPKVELRRECSGLGVKQNAPSDALFITDDLLIYLLSATVN